MFWLVGISLALKPTTLPAKCLDNPIPAEKMRQLIYGGRSQPIRVLTAEWTSAVFMNAIAAILLKEAVGVEVTWGKSTIDGGNGNTELAVCCSSSVALSVGGCPFPHNETIDQCLARSEELSRNDPFGHVSFTAWESYYASIYKRLPEANRPSLYSIGFKALDGMFVGDGPVTAAYEAAGANLLDYAGYDVRWNNVSKHFSTYLDVNKASAKPAEKCSSNVDSSGKLAEEYLAATGDLAGMDGSDQFKCEEGWWFSPACRDNRETCIPAITYAGLSFYSFAQLAFFYKIPLAVASFPWSEYARLPNEPGINLLPYWWYPDDTFFAMGPKPIHFPPANRIEQRKGIWKTASSTATVNKMMWPGLPAVDPAIASFVRSFEMDLASINVALENKFDNPDLTAEDMACEWVRNNEALWTPWVVNVCDAGQYPSLDKCEPCLKGHYCPAGVQKPVPCSPGTKSADVGAATCEPCQQGEEQPEGGTSVCSVCTPGYFSHLPGQAKCKACSAGFFEENYGATACERCAIGSYGTSEGQSKCDICKKTFVTTFRASTKEGDCTCAEGMFWNRADDVCSPCQNEAYCKGGLAIPVVFAGNYAEYVGDNTQMTAGAIQQQQDDQLTGKYIANDGAFKQLRIWSCQSPNCPGVSGMTFPGEYGQDDVTWKELGTQLKMRYPNVCPETRQGIACHLCAAGRFGKDCGPCETNLVGLIILIIVLPFLLLGVYQLTQSPYAAKATASFQLVSTFGIMMMFLQFVSLLGTVEIGWPDVLDNFFDIGNIFLFDLSSIGIGCMVGNGFTSQYWMSIMMPILLIVFMGLACAISQVLPAIKGRNMKMKLDSMLNLLGMIYSALYISLCKVVVSNLECTPMPNEEQGSTLLKYRQVECGSDLHSSTTLPMVLGWIFYVIGFFLVTLYLNVTAPKSFGKIWFRNRCKFLVNRWRADVWYWGSLYLIRNLLVAVSASILSRPVEQILMVAAVMALFLMISSAMCAWKDPILAYFDNSVSLIVIFACYCGIGILPLSIELSRHKREGNSDAAEQTEAAIQTFTVLLTSLLMVGCCAFFAIIAYVAKSSMPTAAKAKAQKDVQHNADIVTAFRTMTAEKNFWTALARTVEVSTVYDVRSIEIFLQNVLHRMDVDVSMKSSVKRRLRASEAGGLRESVALASIDTESGEGSDPYSGEGSDEADWSERHV